MHEILMDYKGKYKEKLKELKEKFDEKIIYNLENLMGMDNEKVIEIFKRKGEYLKCILESFN